MRTLAVRLDATGKGTVTADGADLAPVIGSLYITAHAGHPPTVLVTLPAAELDLDVDAARVHIPEPVAAALVNLGWTPPPTAPPAPVADELDAGEVAP